jgi:AT hook motif
MPQIHDTNPSPSRYLLGMDITNMLAELRTERDQVSEAIAVLGRLALGRGKRRGRPPKWMTEVKRRGRPKGSKSKAK